MGGSRRSVRVRIVVAGPHDERHASPWPQRHARDRRRHVAGGNLEPRRAHQRRQHGGGLDHGEGALYRPRPLVDLEARIQPASFLSVSHALGISTMTKVQSSRVSSLLGVLAMCENSSLPKDSADSLAISPTKVAKLA